MCWPDEDIFKEMKETAIEIWKTYDNTYWYVDEKLDTINSLENIQDNAMVFYRMFDWKNQMIFKTKISDVTEYYINNNL